MNKVIKGGPASGFLEGTLENILLGLSDFSYPASQNHVILS